VVSSEGALPRLPAHRQGSRLYGAERLLRDCLLWPEIGEGDIDRGKIQGGRRVLPDAFEASVPFPFHHVRTLHEQDLHS